MIIVLAALALPAQARADATQALERQLGPQAVVELDDTTGTPRMLARLDGALSGPSAGDKDDVALRYVHEHQAALGLEQADLDALRPSSSTTSGQITTVRWRQAVDGIPAADSELRVNVTGDGRVLNVLGAPASGLDADTTPALGAGEAVRAVQDATNSYRPLVPAGPAEGATRATTYADDTGAELALYRERLAWRVTYRVSSDAVYDAFVDARSGRVLRLANLVKSAAPALVWERYPGAPQGGTAAAKDLELPGWLAAGAPQLDGPNVRAFSDLDDDDRLNSGEEIARESGTFVAAFTPFTGATCDAAPLCSWNPSTANSWAMNRRQNGVQAFYFANKFHDHLRSLGFTDRAFEGADKLVLHTNDGADTAGGLPNSQHINNANMLTLPDGKSPTMQMYLWRSSGYRSVNGGDDAAIIYHEYTHGLSNRLVTDADGAGALNSAQAGAMGEGWSDWYAQDFIGPTDDPGTAGEVDMGAYVDAVAHKLRHQPLDCPVGASPSACPAPTVGAGSGGFTYGDFGRIASGPEVHADGEIWAQTLWDLRGEVGVANARRLITGGMRLSPPEPSFLDMRNAILQADVAFGTGLHDEIWEVFARRGMGFYASADDGADVTPVADFSLPPTAGVPRGRIAGRLTDADTDAPITNGKAAIGGLTDGPDALAGFTGADGGYAIEGVPAHTYPGLVLDAPGYDRQISPVTVTAGTTTPVSAELRRNWAALSGGTSVIGDDEYADWGCGPIAAVDERPGSGWSTDDDSDAAMVLTLPQAVDVSGFAIDPSETCNDTITSATSSIRIETSSDGASWRPAAERGMAAGVKHVPIDVVPPVANVRYVRVTLLDNHGGSFRDLSEFSVYGLPAIGQAPATSTPTATPPPTAPPRPVPTATPSPSPAAPSFVLPASGKRTARLKVTCAASCRMTASLTVDRTTARRLGLGRKLTAATLMRNLKAGTTSITLKLSSAAARALQRGKPGSFRARLKVSATYAGAKPVSRSRQLTIKR